MEMRLEWRRPQQIGFGLTARRTGLETGDIGGWWSIPNMTTQVMKIKILKYW